MEPTPETAIVVGVVAALARSFTEDAWTGFKKRLSKIMGRGDKDETARNAAQLEQDKAKIIEARKSGRQDRVDRVGSMWSLRLEEFLEDHPEHASELRDLIEEFGGKESGTQASQNVINRNVSMDDSTLVAPAIGDVNIGRWKDL